MQSVDLGEHRAESAVEMRREIRAQHHRHGEDHDVDRKSTRLNSSHVEISYAVFCLKKKKNTTRTLQASKWTGCIAHQPRLRPPTRPSGRSTCRSVSYLACQVRCYLTRAH